jgi:hypothetical protein
VVAGYDWFRPDDLPNFFRALQAAPNPAVLVGGQSLTFWVRYFDIPVPETDTPYLTQDADILGSKHDARIVATELGGTLNVPGQDDHTPNTAIVTYNTPDGRKLFVDFMGRLIGLSNEEIRVTAVELEHKEYGLVRVLHPTLVLKSRIANLHQLSDKRDANGIEQARLAVVVLKAFLENFVRSGRAGEDPDGYLIDRVQWLKQLALSDAGIFVFVHWRIDIMQAAPVNLITTPEFHSKNWPQIVKWVRTKQERKKL